LAEAETVETEKAVTEADLQALLMGIEDIPVGGWRLKSPESSGAVSKDSPSGDVCHGDISPYVVGPDATATFQREPYEMWHGVMREENASAAVDKIAAAVSGCEPVQTSFSGEEMTLEYSLIDVPPELGDSAFAFVLRGTKYGWWPDFQVKAVIMGHGEYLNVVGVISTRDEFNDDELFVLAAAAREVVDERAQ